LVAKRLADLSLSVKVAETRHPREVAQRRPSASWSVTLFSLPVLSSEARQYRASRRSDRSLMSRLGGTKDLHVIRIGVMHS
jgi:hypothetical protein